MMQPIDLDELLAAMDGRLWQRGAERFVSVSVDGRTVSSGGLWFAIRGQRDGHEFAPQAIAQGAVGVVLERARAQGRDWPPGVSVIEVDDTVRALGRLARARRRGLAALRVVGVTGSNGKTTTKEMIAAILAAQAGEESVHKTEGNFNNHLGVPLTLLGLGPEHRYAVIEMGMSARGEIAYLADLAAPDVGVVVNVAPVHLETLGSLEEVARAKGEMLAALAASGTAVYPDDDVRLAMQAEASPAVRRVRFGVRPGTAVRLLRAQISAQGTEVTLRLPRGERLDVRVAAVGWHHGRNAAAAVAAAYALGADAEHIAGGLQAAHVARHRSTLAEIGGRHVLDDCYNASPLSTAAALDTLAELRRQGGGRALAVLGDMLELGRETAALHRGVGERAARVGVDRLLTIGGHAGELIEGARRAGAPAEAAMEFTNIESLTKFVLDHSQAGDWILIKASRGMKLERVLEGLQLGLGEKKGV